MQDNNVGLLIGIAGFAVVCAGLLFVALLIVLRVTGRSAMSFLSFFIRGSMEEREDNSPSFIPRPKPDLRQVASSVDFDAAVAKNETLQPRSDSFDMQATGSAPAKQDDGWQNLSTPSLQRAQGLARQPDPRRRKSEFHEDEVFGGLLDADGDGDPDN